MAADLYPAIEPYESGMFPAGDWHEIYYEISGNPKGKPVVFLHGGPGSGSGPEHPRFFDPKRYRILVFDQRGCGRSVPIASIEANTTQHLIADIEALREKLGVKRWVVFGGSWGSTLGLAYAAAHPEACTALVMRGIWLCRKADLQWWLYGVRSIFTEFWDDFANYLPPNERGDLLENYFKLLVHPDPAVHMPAAANWKTYESRIAVLIPKAGAEKSQSPRTLAMSRIEAHYMVNRGFLAPGELLAGMAALAKHPAVIVQGRYDMVCPNFSAHDLHQAWPEAAYRIVDDAGHSAWEPGIRSALVDATESFRRRRRFS